MKLVPLTKGHSAMVDDDDYERVSKFKWHVSREIAGWPKYAKVSRGRVIGDTTKVLYLHRFILEAPDNMQVDHIDGDGLNCQRSNLRLATNSQNCCNRRLPSNNTTGHKGVTKRKRDGIYEAYIKTGGQLIYLGSFKDFSKAVEVRQAAEKQYHGEFSRRQS